MTLFMILALTVALPILCVTYIIVLVISRKQQKNRMSSEEERQLSEIYYGMKDLNKRIENLESLMHDR